MGKYINRNHYAAYTSIVDYHKKISFGLEGALKPYHPF